MAAVFQRTGVAMTAGFCVFAMAAIGGFAAGFNARTGLSAFTPAEISAADNVTLRFPTDWSETPSAPVGLAFASADASLPLFDPTPTYPIATETALMAETTSSVPVQVPEPKMQVAALTKPANPAPRPAHRSNAVLNETQLASIKKRLNLSPDQERYWPAIAAELRKMEYKKDHKTGTQTAAVDMSKVNVEGLKSAGFPLVMSFSDDQRRELQSLAHLLGLESVLLTF